MRRAKRRIFSGVVCEQIVFSIPDRLKNLDKAEPRPRFKNEAEREAHKLAISRRKHNEFFNENFSPTSLYSTLTLDNEHEVHTFDEAGHLLDLYVRRLKYDYPDAVIFAYIDYTAEETPEPAKKPEESLRALVREVVLEVLEELNPIYKDLADVPDYWKAAAEAMLEAGAINGGTPEEVNPTDLNIRRETFKAAVVALAYHDAREKHSEK